MGRNTRDSMVRSFRGRKAGAHLVSQAVPSLRYGGTDTNERLSAAFVLLPNISWPRVYARSRKG
jgi:hypothetical protein